MSLSPSSTESRPLSLHNSGNRDTSTVVTAILTFAPANAAITAVEDVIGATHVTVTVSGTAITIQSKVGSGNRGKYKVKVTPPSGCGSVQYIWVDVSR